MARQIVFAAKAAKPPATYSQAVKAAGLVFVSGTAPTDPSTGQIAGTTIQEQTRQCLENIAAILEEAGSSLDKIVSCDGRPRGRGRLRRHERGVAALVPVGSPGAPGREASREDPRPQGVDRGDRRGVTQAWPTS